MPSMTHSAKNNESLPIGIGMGGFFKNAQWDSTFEPDMPVDITTTGSRYNPAIAHQDYGAKNLSIIPWVMHVT